METYKKSDEKVNMVKKKRRKCSILAIVQKQDPNRFRIRTVKSEKGKGRKDRPRDNRFDEIFDYAEQGNCHHNQGSHASVTQRTAWQFPKLLVGSSNLPGGTDKTKPRR